MYLDSLLDTPVGATGGPAVTQQVLEDQYGVDIAFRGKLLVGPDGDYQLVRGIENLRASVYRRLYTRPGEYKVNPSYGVGLPSYVKQKLTQTLQDRLRHDIATQLTRDRRIARVGDISITQFTDASGGQGLRVALSVVAFGRSIALRPFNFTEVR